MGEGSPITKKAIQLILERSGFMTKPKKVDIPISTFISDNENYLKQTVGLGVTYDVGIRKFQILNKRNWCVICKRTL